MIQRIAVSFLQPHQVPGDSVSSSQRKQLQHLLDVRGLPAETSSFAARPLLLWAFQSSQWQLQAVFGQRPSLPHVTAAQRRAFGSHFGAKQRQSFLTCSRLSVTLAVRLMCFRSASAGEVHTRARESLLDPGCPCETPRKFVSVLLT